MNCRWHAPVLIIALSAFCLGAKVTASEIDGAEVSILAWNLQNFTTAPNRENFPGVGTARDAEEIVYMRDVAVSFQADVLAVQELAEPVDLAIFGTHYRMSIEGRALSPRRMIRDRFTAVGTSLSSHLNQVQFQDLHTGECLTPAADCVRDFAGVVLQKDDLSLEVYSVHMKSSCEVRDPFASTTADCATLIRQYKRLLDELRRRQGKVIVLVGDFNRRIAGGKERMLRWISASLPEGTEAREYHAMQACRIGNSKREDPIDYAIVVYPQGVNVEAAVTTISFFETTYATLRLRVDHCPILFNFRFYGGG